MSRGSLIFVSASSSETSRSSRIAKEVERFVRRRAGVDAQCFSLQGLIPRSAWFDGIEAHDVDRFVRAVENADGIVLSTPVHEANYPGVLDRVVDLIPPQALEGKVALGIATARRAEEFASAASSFRSLFAFFSVAHVVPAIFLSEDTVFGDREHWSLHPQAQEQVQRAAGGLLEWLTRRNLEAFPGVAPGFVALGSRD